MIPCNIQVKSLPLLEGEGRGEVFKKVNHPVVIIIRASSQSKKSELILKRKADLAASLSEIIPMKD